MTRLAYRALVKGAVVIIILSAALLACSSNAHAQEVLAGIDLWETPPGSTFYDTSNIPPGFFDTGSQPIAPPVVPLRGIPLEPSAGFPPGSGLGPTDTIVRRLATTSGIGGPPIAQDTIPIEIVALHLQSIQPIIVTYSSAPSEQWIMDVVLQPVPQQPGQMTIEKNHPNGGTFDSFLPVLPRLIFTRVGDNAVCVFDDGLDQLQQANPPLTFPWSYTPSPDALQTGYSNGGYTQTNFWPGVKPIDPSFPLQNIIYNGTRLDLTQHLATPEPGSLALIALGGALILRRARR